MMILGMYLSVTVYNLTKENYNPILIFKPWLSKTEYGPCNLDTLPNSNKLYAFGFQTLEQKEMLLKNSHRALCIDATFRTNQYNFYLITLIIPDEYRQGYPVAHFITNRLDYDTMVCLFTSSKNQFKHQ